VWLQRKDVSRCWGQLESGYRVVNLRGKAYYSFYRAAVVREARANKPKKAFCR
jgi:hypothetical protein